MLISCHAENDSGDRFPTAIVALVQSIGTVGPLDSIFGLPTHPMAAAIAAVLLSLSAIGAIAMALIPRWCRRFGILVWPLIGVSTLACLIAQGSGEALAKHIATPPQHAYLGAQLKYLGAALIVVTFVLWLLDHRTGGPRPLSVKVLAAVVIVIALMAIVWTVRAGDSGARQLWAPALQRSAALDTLPSHSGPLQSGRLVWGRSHWSR